MVYLSQRDGRWAEKTLGASKLTIGRYGCTTTCISMLSDFFGKFQDPAKIAAHREFYTPDGLVQWPKLAIPGMKFVWRGTGRNDSYIREAINDKNGAIILQVNFGQHWIVAVRKMWLSNDYICIDPWTGKTCAAIGDYKNITGFAHFKKA